MNNPASVSTEPSRELKELAAQWVARCDAGLSAAEEVEFQGWLAADPRHKAAMAWYGGPWLALDRPARAGVADDVLGQLRVLDRRQRRRRMSAIAATVAIALIATGVWQGMLRSNAVDSAASAGTARLILPAQRTLPDGSTVELKDGAEIAVNYSPSARGIVLLHGEAHFDVAKDAARPFVVSVADVDFRAVGTAFAVHRDADQIGLVVTEGRVAVDRHTEAPVVEQEVAVTGPDSRPQTIAMVDAGRQLVVPVGTETAAAPAAYELSAAQMADRLSWRAPRLEFSGTPLVEAIDLLNAQFARQNLGRVVIGDPALERMKISGMFRADSTSALVELLEVGFGVKAEKGRDMEIVLRRGR